MSEKIRMIFTNSYDTCEFEDPLNDTIYYTEAFTDGAPVVMGPGEAKSSSRSDVMSVKPTTQYKLQGNMQVPAPLGALALVRSSIPANCTLSLKMWNLEDWYSSTGASGDPGDTGDWIDVNYNVYTAKLEVAYLGTSLGWGEFNWGHPWGADSEFTVGGNPMSNVMMFWFDDLRNVNQQLTDSLDQLLNAPVEGVVKWELRIEPAETSAIFIDRIYLGDYYNIAYNISHGHSMIFQDTSKQYRTDGGSLRTNIKHRFKHIKFVFSVISPIDRTHLARQFAMAGVHEDTLVSVYPLNGDTGLEQDYTMVGKFTKVPVMTEIIGGYYKTAIDMEET